MISGQSMRILLISVREGARDEVGEALAGRVGDHRLYWVSQPEMALARAQDVAPHAILVDSELHGASMVLLIKQLTQRVPGAAVLAMVEWDAMSAASEAVLAGARGFVIKPLNGDDLLAALRSVLTQRRPTDEAIVAEEATGGQVIVFCAPKGGTGRTTTAINTAIGLASRPRQSVVLVDADYAAPALDVALNLDGDRTIADLLPRLSLLDKELVQGVLATHSSGLQVLLAPPPAGLLNPMSLPQVQHILAVLKEMFDWVIVDLGLPLDETAFSFLDSADRIVMTALPEMVGLRNVRLMLNQFQGRGYAEDKIWLVLNRSTIAGGVTTRDIEERLKVRVRHRVPDDQPLVTHSVNRGVPLLVSHPKSAVARAIDKLAERLLADGGGVAETPAEEEAPAPASGLLGRLKRARATDS